jgi:hypothetical protein
MNADNMLYHRILGLLKEVFKWWHRCQGVQDVQKKKEG